MSSDAVVIGPLRVKPPTDKRQSLNWASTFDRFDRCTIQLLPTKTKDYNI